MILRPAIIPSTMRIIPNDPSPPNHVAHKNAPKFTTSNKAVGFANPAIANKNHDTAMILVLIVLFSCTERRKTKPL
ncbi:MAG: hypothetical protein RL023_91 [Candidatus Parcubacteria bacterium]|jgi:hypothetical protein